MKKLFVLLALFTAPFLRADHPQVLLQAVVRQTNGGSNPIGSVWMEAANQDENETTGRSTQYQLRLCLDDSTWNCVSGNSVTVTANQAAPDIGTSTCPAAGPCYYHQYNWQPPTGTIGSVTPRDGKEHFLYVWAISTLGDSQANDTLADFTYGGFPFRWDTVNNNILPTYTPVVTSASPMSPSQVAVIADASQSYSVGSAGSTVCTVGGTAVKDDGVAGYFVRKHGIPCGNVYVTSLGATADAIPVVTFNLRLNALLNGLPTSVQYIVLAWLRPDVVIGAGNGACDFSTGGSNCYGITGWTMMYSTTNGVEPAGSACVQRSSGLGQGPRNPWFNSGTNSTPFLTNRVRPTIMLGAALCPTCTRDENAHQGVVEDFGTMRAVIDAAAGAIGTNPPQGNVQVAWTSDVRGAVLSEAYSTLDGGSALSGNVSYSLLGSAASPTSTDVTSGTGTNVLAYFNGATTFNLPSIRFIPGVGFGYNVSSYFAEVFAAGTGQTPYTSYLYSSSVNNGGIQNGVPAVAAGGTATEPCESLQFKAVDPALFTSYYAAGWNVLQTFWKAYSDPWNVNMTGDPFAQPYSNAGGALTISTLNPASVLAGNADFTLTVNGAGFTPGDTVLWNGVALTTTLVDPTRLTALAPASLIAQQGSASITVVRDGGTLSNAVLLSIRTPLIRRFESTR